MWKYIIPLIFFSFPVFANDIYITQSGDDLDLAITQDGQDNEFGDSTTDVLLDGDDMTFTITQTGNFNEIDALIKGNSYTGTWVFTGDDNTVDLTCDDTSGTNCEDVTLNITTTGDDNKFLFRIGESADAEDLVADFTITGDGNVIDVDQDGKAADIAVTINNANSIASGTVSDSNSGLSTEAPGNYVKIDQSGAGDVAGHSITLSITGGGGWFSINQSGIYDTKVDATFVGDNAEVDIIQRD